MKSIERCPACDDVMIGRTNQSGNVYLECVDCGHFEAVCRKTSPFPDRVYRQPDGRLRRRHARLPGTTHEARKSA